MVYLSFIIKLANYCLCFSFLYIKMLIKKIKINCYKIQFPIIIYLQIHSITFEVYMKKTFFFISVAIIVNVWSTQEKDENIISGIAFITYAQSKIIKRSNNTKVFNSKKAKEPKQKNPNWLCSLVS